MKKYVLAIDQGTTTTRAIIFDKESNIMGKAQMEFSQICPKSFYCCSGFYIKRKTVHGIKYHFLKVV